MEELCLVTGGAGFIGSHLVEALVGDGRAVRVLDDLSTGLADHLARLGPRVELIHGDVVEAAAVEKAMVGVGVVFHLAARASVQFSLEDPLGCHHVCATGTLQVLQAARRAGACRVVYAASASAYGLPTAAVQTEADLPSALSPYAAAKLAGEFYAQAFAASFGLSTVTLRFFNIFGPRQRADSPYSGVIALFASAMMQGRTPTIFGDGLQSRDFTYVADVVQALLRAANAPHVAGQTYNVGTGRSVNLLELVATLNRLLGTNISPRHGPARPGDVRHSRADITSLRRDLGYEPGVSFEEGLRRTLEWYRSGERGASVP